MTAPKVDHAARAAEILAVQDPGRYDVDEAAVHARLALVEQVKRVADALAERGGGTLHDYSGLDPLGQDKP